ncbi:uncharacterized protein LOC114841500 [Diachasma alloeum]|uniref:Odorant receptor n=1 Tax=Diachasma alloeum TaxID=454923 RepID=A0A4E0S3V7_9HYME|nr:uncharacterized protein LOC114841500 [Diachasma alloeum]THK33175.1 odorant receptor 65 [Diachasma alloeum]
MLGKITPEHGIQWTKLGTWIIFTWPPNSKATRLTKMSFQIGWWISLFFTIISLPFGFDTAWALRENTLMLVEILCLYICLIQVVAKMVIAKLNYHKFQYLMEKMETFVKNANPHERQVLITCVKRIAPSHLSYNMLCIIAALLYALAPFATGQPFPTVTQFPFPTDKHPTYDMIFFLQAINGFQCCASNFFDSQLSILLCYGTIQLDILAEKMRNVNSVEKLKECISTHQDILRYVDDTIKAVRPVVITTVITATISLAFAGILIIGNGSIVHKIEFAGIILAYSCELLCFAWAAESLTTAYEQVGWALYSSTWIQNSKEFKRTAIFVMHRCQKPPAIRFGGLMPKLSMSYYASYMSATYSFFNAVRATLK